MIKHIIFIVLIAVAILGGYCFFFGVPKTSASWANFGSYSGGTFVAVLTVYGLLYAIYTAKLNNQPKSEVHNLEHSAIKIQKHVDMMNSYKSPHSGGYSGDGYRFLKWLWPTTTSQLLRDNTIEHIRTNNNLREMKQWHRSIKSFSKEELSELAGSLSPEEVKLLRLYAAADLIPDTFTPAIAIEFDKLSLTDNEKMLFEPYVENVVLKTKCPKCKSSAVEKERFKGSLTGDLICRSCQYSDFPTKFKIVRT